MRAKAPSAPGEVDPRVALRAFTRLADRWELGRSQRARLLRVSEKSIARYEVAPPHDLDPDKLERISYLLGIYRGLNTIFGDKSASAIDWLRLPNTAFGGMTPLERMLAGNVADLAFVRAYVDRQVDPW